MQSSSGRLRSDELLGNRKCNEVAPSLILSSPFSEVSKLYLKPKRECSVLKQDLEEQLERQKLHYIP